MILQIEGEPAQHIHVPEHRTEPVHCGESVYIGVLTSTKKRKVLRTFDNAAPGHDEAVMPADVPLEVQRILDRGFERLEQLYFPKSASR